MTGRPPDPDTRMAGPVAPPSSESRPARNHDAASLPPVAYDWRASARSTETGLAPIDRALTGTGLAAEIRGCVLRLVRLT